MNMTGKVLTVQEVLVRMALRLRYRFSRSYRCSLAMERLKNA